LCRDQGEKINEKVNSGEQKKIEQEERIAEKGENEMGVLDISAWPERENHPKRN